MGRTPLTARHVRIDGLFREVFDTLNASLDGRAVDFIVRELPPCEADPTLIRQVIQNLLDNALKFTRTRDTARIEVDGWVNGEMAEYSVRDNGVGFDSRYSDKLFGVFQRLHRPDEYEGTGVGLAIVQRVIQRHGGRVWFEAVPDQGATFYFSLRRGNANDNANDR